MERLTRCVGMVNGKPVYKANIDMRKMGSVDKLKNALGQYEDAEEQGLLLKLPCKVGTKVYQIHTLLKSGRKVVAEIEADAFFLTLCVLEKRFGKTVFLTQEEAENTLIELSN